MTGCNGPTGEIDQDSKNERVSWWGRARRPGASVLFMMLALQPRVLFAQMVPNYLRDVVYYNAPFIIGETRNGASNPEAVDHLLPVDFDNDNLGSNNQTNAEVGTVPNGASTVYYSIVESGSSSSAGYYYIGYYFYHPKDGGGTYVFPGGQTTSNGHQHDMEGIYLVVKKSPYAPFGILMLSFTEAHGHLVPFRSPGRFSPDPPPQPCCDIPGFFHDWAGVNNVWYDNVAGVDRPVVAVRSRTHGTYMAQNCIDDPFAPYGIDVSYYQSTGNMYVCPHNDSQFILYRPEYFNQGLAQRLGPTVRSGTWYYRLISIQESPIWPLRASQNVLFGGQLRSIGTRGETGLDKFATTNPQSEAANPPWAWFGNGECHYGNTWFTFARDNNGNYNPCPTWPVIDPGRLLTDPVSAVIKKFPWFTEIQQYSYQYFPYTNPPGSPYCTDCANSYQAMSLSITGPDQVVAGKAARWTASVSGGTAPYTYQWSGALSGTGSSITGALSSDDVLYLDVWDETGAQISVSKPITVDSCQSGRVC